MSTALDADGRVEKRRIGVLHTVQCTYMQTTTVHRDSCSYSLD